MDFRVLVKKARSNEKLKQDLNNCGEFTRCILKDGGVLKASISLGKSKAWVSAQARKEIEEYAKKYPSSELGVLIRNYEGSKVRMLFYKE